MTDPGQVEKCVQGLQIGEVHELVNHGFCVSKEHKMAREVEQDVISVDGAARNKEIIISCYIPRDCKIILIKHRSTA